VERVEPLGDRRHRLVGGQDAFAGGNERPGGFFEIVFRHVDLLFIA
jgi:hypothetical protein